MSIYCTRVLTLNLEGALPFCSLYFEWSDPLLIPQTDHILFKSQDLCPSPSLHLEWDFLPPLILSLWQISSYLSRPMSTVTFSLWPFMAPSAPTPTPGRINCSLNWSPTHFILTSSDMSNTLLHGIFTSMWGKHMCSFRGLTQGQNACFKSWLQYLTFQCLHLLIYKVEIKLVPTHRFIVE